MNFVVRIVPETLKRSFGILMIKRFNALIVREKKSYDCCHLFPRPEGDREMRFLQPPPVDHPDRVSLEPHERRTVSS